MKKRVKKRVRQPKPEKNLKIIISFSEAEKFAIRSERRHVLEILSSVWASYQST